jgi:large subunit ribosomal protein L25
MKAEPRTEFGKGAARRVRRADKVPAVLYGHGADPVHLSLPGHDLMLALKTSNVLIRLEGMKGGNKLALPKAVQRDPIKGFLRHVDLLLVERGEKVRVDVPLHLVGEVTPGGLVEQSLDTLAIEAEATAIPGGFDVSIDGLEIGAAVHAKDVVLPAEVTLQTDPEAMVVHVSAAPTAEQVEAELEGAEAEAGIEREEAAAPEEAAPAAPAEEQRPEESEQG